MTPRRRDPSAPALDGKRQISAWAASGAMALTGRPGLARLGPPADMGPKLLGVAGLLRSRAAELGGQLEVEPLSLLGERAALSGLAAGGDISCGGATRLLAAGHRWIAVTLARADDVELVPAWLELDRPAADAWTAVAAAVAARPLDELVARAVLLGLPIGVLPSPCWDAAAPRSDAGFLPIRRLAVPGPPGRSGALSGVVVVDLSALWAGPLCGSLLAGAGATVIKVESTTRPDGARLGPPAFFDLLNAGKPQRGPRPAAVTSGALPQRVMVTGGPELTDAPWPAGIERGPVKLVIDDDTYPGLDLLAAQIASAHQHGRAVAIHCVTRTALVLALAAWDVAGSRTGDRVEHGSVIPSELVGDLLRHRLIVVTQPGFVAERGDEYLQEVDAADLPHLYRCASLLAAGVRVAGSTDAPYTSPDPWRAMRAAVSRQAPSGAVVGPAEAASPMRALQLFLGDLHDPAGPPRSVIVGAPADLCLLAHPLAAVLTRLRADDVAATLCAGRVVHDTRRSD